MKVTKLEVVDSVFTRVYFKDKNHLSCNDCFSDGAIKVGDIIVWDSWGSVWKKV